MSGKLKKSLACHCLVLSTLGSVLLNTGSCLCSYKGTYTYKQEPPSDNPWVLSVLHIGHLEQVTNLGVSNIKRCLAYFQSFIERCLPHRWTTLRGVHRKVTPTWFQFQHDFTTSWGQINFFFDGGWGGWKILKQIVCRGWNTEIICMEIKQCLQQDGETKKIMLAAGATCKQMFACENFPNLSPPPPPYTHTHPAPVENNGPSLLVVLIVCSHRTQSQ